MSSNKDRSSSVKKFGILNVYKPINMTSFDVVREIRKLTNEKKVGHCGTLDPLACGVLPVCIGKATKAIDYIMDNNKEYIATLKLGEITDTYDLEGKVISTSDVKVNEEQVIEAVNSFKGTIKQVPPMYSALKVNGKKLYELARQGIEIERKPRDISIYDIDILSIDIPNVIFQVKCSKGTYIRSLCYDIGKKLKCGATMTALERSATGSFNIESSIHIDNLTSENISKHLLAIDTALDDFPKITFDKKHEKLLLNGVIIKDRKLIDHIELNDFYRVYLEDTFIGIGKRNSIGFKIEKLLL